MIQLPHHRWQPNSLRELIWVVGIAVALVHDQETFWSMDRGAL